MSTNAIVPMNVAALRVSSNDNSNIVHQFKGRTAVFENMPHGTAAKIASTGDQIIRPLEGGNPAIDALGIGVHVHWELPDYFRRGTQPAQGGDVVFPQVPNRWLVIRYFSQLDPGTNEYGPVSTKCFLIESDYVNWQALPDAYGIKRPTIPVPLNPPAPNSAQPFSYMGRVLNYEDWNPSSETPRMFLPSYSGEDKQPLYLTSTGFVGPTFSTYYPECCSVFGFWDHFADMPSVFSAINNNQPPIQFRVSYQVTGWIDTQQAQSDPLANFAATVTTQYNKYVQQCQQQGVAVTQTPADYFVNLAKQEFHWTFQAADIGYTLNSDQTLQSLNGPQQTLCNGVMQEVVWNMLGTPGSQYFLQTDNPQSPAIWNDTVEVAAGNTTIEALSALLKKDMGNRDNDPDLLKNYEFLLDALQLGMLNSLEGQSNRIISLEEALHAKGFSQAQGGLLWVISAPQSNPGVAPNPDQEITLPLDLAEQLNLLNLAQKSYDQGRSALDAARKQLFMDWIRWVKLSVSGDTDPYVSTNAISAFLSSSGACEINSVVAAGNATGILLYQKDPTSGSILAPVQPSGTSSLAYNVWTQYQAVTEALANYPAWTISSAPADPFYLPTDPVLLMEGNRMEPVRRNGSSDYTAVRVTSELLSNITLTYAAATFSIAANALSGVPQVSAITPMQADVQTLTGESYLLMPMLAPICASALAAQGGTNNPAVADLASFTAALQSAQGGMSPLDGNPAPGLFAAVRQDGYKPAPNQQQSVTSPQSITFTFTNSASNGWTPDPVAWTTQLALPEFSATRYDPFLPVSLVWTVSFDPLQWNNGRSYDAANLTGYFQMDADAVDYQYLMNGGSAVPFTSSTALSYSGSVSLSKRPTVSLTQQINKYIANYPTDPADPKLDNIRAAYQTRKFLSQALSGFSTQQTLRAYIPQIPVENLANPRDAISSNINTLATAVPADDWYDFGFNSVTPIATGLLAQYNFGPLRSGFLEVKSLEVVDAFGQLMTLSTSPQSMDGSLQVITAMTFAPQSGDAANQGKVFLPPRLIAPTRLWFRWLSATFDSNIGGISNDFVEVNTHPASTPVCGWIMPNHLDNSLFFYDIDGSPIGSFGVEHGDLVYRTRAGNTNNPSNSLAADVGPQGSPTVNLHTANFMWFVNGQSAGFLTDLMTTMLASEQFISPANYAQNSTLAVLIGRPLAITRAVLGMETSGNVLPISQADTSPTDPFPSDILNGRVDYSDRQQASSANLGGVNFPLRLGELSDIDDGMVGYLIEGSGANPYSVIYAPAAPASGGNNVVQPTPTTIQLNLNAQPLTVTMLIDPRAGVHATTGVLPVAELSIPSDQYAQTMQNLEMTFFTMPVLSEADGLAIPLPQESGYSWVWINPGNTLVPLKANAVNENAAYGYSPQTLLEGWLALIPAPLTLKKP